MDMTDLQKSALIGRLVAENCSCVISNGNEIYVGRERGVADLFRLLKENPGLLAGAFVADKVVGKGAAAIMVSGGVAEVHALVISRPALELVQRSGVTVSYGELVGNIINRNRTGICPVEALCADCHTAAECLPLIEDFISRQKRQASQ